MWFHLHCQKLPDRKVSLARKAVSNLVRVILIECPHISSTPFRDPCCHFQAGFARQPAGLDPIFTSIVHGSSQLCPLLAQAQTSQPTKGSKCSSLFLPPSLSRGFWTAELFPIPFHSFAFDTVSPSSNWTLHLEMDSPVTEIQVSGQE